MLPFVIGSCRVDRARKIMTEPKIATEIDLPPKGGGAVVEMRNGESAELPVIQSETMALIQMIERAARDPTVDVNKFKQLMDMRLTLEDRAAQRSYDLAMTEAQTEMAPVRADANNPQTKSKYASYFALDNALRPIYTKHGFALSFDTGDGAPADHVRVICFVSHNGGDKRTKHIDMPADGKGAKGGDVMTKTHATGSAVSYGMRYLLKMIFNIVVGVDDDGNAAGAADMAPINAKQVATIQKLIVESGADIKRFCAYAKVERIEEIPARHFKAAVAMLEKKIAKGAKA
jgi:hypothetical protein